MLSCNIWGQVCFSVFDIFKKFFFKHWSFFEGWGCNYKLSWFSLAFCEIALCSIGCRWWHVYATLKRGKSFVLKMTLVWVEGGFTVPRIKLVGALESGKNVCCVFAWKFHTVVQKGWLSPVSAIRTECVSSERWPAAWFRWSVYSKTEVGWCLNTPGECSCVGSHG